MAQVFDFGIGLTAVDDATPAIHGVIESLGVLQDRVTGLDRVMGQRAFQSFNRGVMGAQREVEGLAHSMDSLSGVRLQDVFGGVDLSLLVRDTTDMEEGVAGMRDRLSEVQANVQRLLSLREEESRLQEQITEGMAEEQRLLAETRDDHQKLIKQRHDEIKAATERREIEREFLQMQKQVDYHNEDLEETVHLAEKHLIAVKAVVAAEERRDLPEQLQLEAQRTMNAQRRLKIEREMERSVGVLDDHFDEATERAEALAKAMRTVREQSERARDAQAALKAEKIKSSPLAAAGADIKGLGKKALAALPGTLRKIVSTLGDLGTAGLETQHVLTQLGAEMGLTAQQTGLVADNLFDVSLNLQGVNAQADPKAVRDLTVAYGQLGGQLRNLDTQKEQKQLVRLVDTFGVSADEAARFQRAMELSDGTVKELLDTGASFQKKFGVPGLIQTIPESVEFAKKAQQEFSLVVDRSAGAITKDITRIAAVYAKGLGRTAPEAARTARESFQSFSGELLSFRKAFLGLGGFSPLVKAFQEVGVPLSRVQQLLVMGQKEPAKFAEEYKKMEAALRGRGLNFAADRLRIQVLEGIPEGTRALITGEKELRNTQEERRKADAKAGQSIDTLTDKMRGTAQTSLQTVDNMKELAKVIIGFDSVQTAGFTKTVDVIRSGLVTVNEELAKARKGLGDYAEAYKKFTNITGAATAAEKTGAAAAAFGALDLALAAGAGAGGLKVGQALRNRLRGGKAPKAPKAPSAPRAPAARASNPNSARAAARAAELRAKGVKVSTGPRPAPRIPSPTPVPKPAPATPGRLARMGIAARGATRALGPLAFILGGGIEARGRYQKEGLTGGTAAQFVGGGTNTLGFGFADPIVQALSGYGGLGDLGAAGAGSMTVRKGIEGSDVDALFKAFGTTQAEAGAGTKAGVATLGAGMGVGKTVSDLGEIPLNFVARQAGFDDFKDMVLADMGLDSGTQGMATNEQFERTLGRHRNTIFGEASRRKRAEIMGGGSLGLQDRQVELMSLLGGGPRAGNLSEALKGRALPYEPGKLKAIQSAANMRLLDIAEGGVETKEIRKEMRALQDLVVKITKALEDSKKTNTALLNFIRQEAKKPPVTLNVNGEKRDVTRGMR